MIVPTPLDPRRYLDKMAHKLIRSFAKGAQVFFHYTGTYVGNTNVYIVVRA